MVDDSGVLAAVLFGESESAGESGRVEIDRMSLPFYLLWTNFKI